MLPTRTLAELRSLPVVLIGCDTGLGNAVATYLSETLGMTHVYAGCFSETSFSSLAQCKRCFQIDVRSVASIHAAVELVRGQEPRGVFTVVNVAGAMMGGPIEWTDTDVFRAEIELNYLGLLNVVKAFLPLLKTWKSETGKQARFVAVTSTIAIMPSFPGLSGYAASKAGSFVCCKVNIRCG
jgi:retinol dehydrogenase-16